MPELELQPSLQSDLRSRALLPLAIRLGAIDVSQILSYWIDHVDASVLPYLQWQFDLTNRFWQLVAPLGQPDNRELIKRGITLHAMRGTPRALKLALQALGWGVPPPNDPSDPLEKNFPAGITVVDLPLLDPTRIHILEGQDKWGGTNWPPNEGWAVYRVVLPSISMAIELLPGDVAWNHLHQYQPGFGPNGVVRYPGPSGGWFLAISKPPIGAPPYYLEIGDVGRTINDLGVLRPNLPNIGDMRWLAQMGGPGGDLTTRFWVPLTEINGALYRVLTQADLSLIIAACKFFAPVSRWLDSAIFNQASVIDSIFGKWPWTDQVNAPAGVAVTIKDSIFGKWPWTDSLAVILPSITETVRFVPKHSGAWRHGGGIDYSATPVGFTDGPIVVNGEPHRDH